MGEEPADKTCPKVEEAKNEEKAAKMWPKDEEPEDDEAAKMWPKDEEPVDDEAAKMWPNKDEEDEGYDTIRKRGRSHKVAKTEKEAAKTIFSSCCRLRLT